MNDIDLVYLWVNGNDPVWVAKRDAFIGKSSDEQANCKGRYVDNGELKFSLRSVEKYAPWIHRIYIVTDHQVPEWLDTNNPKIQIVDHTEIMPAECLPCFNSALIEQFLQNIPGLSEHFLYANDDTLINRPVTPHTFFHKDGRPFFFLRKKKFRKMTYFFWEKVLGKNLTTNILAIKNASKLVEKRYGRYYGHKPHHNIDAYQKSTLISIAEDMQDELRHMWSSRMRQPNDVHRIVFTYAALARRLGYAKFVNCDHSFCVLIHKPGMYDEFEQVQPILFCMNDSEHANDKDREKSRLFLERLFPEKSSFEK